MHAYMHLLLIWLFCPGLKYCSAEDNRIILVYRKSVVYYSTKDKLIINNVFEFITVATPRTLKLSYFISECLTLTIRNVYHTHVHADTCILDY